MYIGESEYIYVGELYDYQISSSFFLLYEIPHSDVFWEVIIVESKIMEFPNYHLYLHELSYRIIPNFIFSRTC